MVLDDIAHDQSSSAPSAPREGPLDSMISTPCVTASSASWLPVIAPSQQQGHGQGSTRICTLGGAGVASDIETLGNIDLEMNKE